MTAVRIAYIAEDVDVDDRGPIATGLFTGGVQAEDGSIDETIENLLSLAEALRWGRERADQVVLRVAGEDPCTDPPPEASRTVGRRRPAGWEFLDRTAADPPISWDVVVEVQTSALSRPHPPGPWTDYATTP